MAEFLLQNPFIFTFISIFLEWQFVKRVAATTNSKNLPPSPPKLPIIGNLHQIATLPHQSLQSMSKKYGPLMLLHFGNVPTLIVSSADAAREIMKTYDVIFADRPDSSVQSFHAIREEETALMMEKIKESCLSSSPLNMSDLFTAITNDVVCRSAFGRKYRDGATGEKFLQLITEFLGLLGTISVGEFIPWLAWINRVSGFDARVNFAAKELDEFLEGVIQEHWDMENSSGKDESKENFVDILLKIYQDNTTGVSIDRDGIKAIILDVFAAGTDTTSTVLEWAMTELLRHPIVMKKLQNEVRGVLNGNHDITDADLEKMHYLKAVLKETLRFHTPIPLLVPREAREDVKVMGYDIAAGTMVMTNVWAIGQDPLYWKEPQKFQPERFLNSSIDFKGLDFQLIPFGAGRRGCPEISFAMATNELILANIVQKFDWELPNGAKGGYLDMSERPGVSIHRKVPLFAVATQCYL